MINKNFAPIVIFAYNRPSKIHSLLKSLENNQELKYSKIIFYIDKYSTIAEKENNLKVISTIKKWSENYITEINIRTYNMGLKENILDGINNIFLKYESAIFLEDDLIVSSNFLNFINSSLKKYKFIKKVKHISGYNFPINNSNYNSSFFTNYMSCWGWATWKDRWEKNLNYSKNEITNKNKFLRLKFTVYGYEKDFESQLKRNELGDINTWAIFWYQHIFLNKGLCLNPCISLVQNNGHEGEHGINISIYNSQINQNKVDKFPKLLIINYLNLLKLIIFYRKKNILKNN